MTNCDTINCQKLAVYRVRPALFAKAGMRGRLCCVDCAEKLLAMGREKGLEWQRETYGERGSDHDG